MLRSHYPCFVAGRPRKTAEELEALGKAMRKAEKAGKIHASALLALRLLALTGMRRSELLGHESITTTEIYTHLDRDYLRQVVQEFHPRS